MTKTALPLLAAFTLLLSGCGGSDGDKDTSSDLGVPKCSAVWKVGETIDLNKYEGCENGDTLEVAITRGCYDANSKYLGQFATFEDRLWVIQTGTDPETGDGGTPGKVTDVDPKC